MCGKLLRLMMLACALSALSGVARAGEQKPVDLFLQDLKCLSLNVHFEAGNQDDRGMLAVGQVVANRIVHGKFPDRVCEVVFERSEGRGCQFSWVCESWSPPWNDKPAWQRAVRLACEVLSGKAPSIVGSSIYYHAQSVRPEWAKGRAPDHHVGQHLFFEDFDEQAVNADPMQPYTHPFEEAGTICANIGRNPDLSTYVLSVKLDCARVGPNQCK